MKYLIAVLLIATAAACGVKGDPLPVASTEQQG